MIIANEAAIKRYLKIFYELAEIHNNMDYMPIVRQAALENLLVVHNRLQQLGITIELIETESEQAQREWYQKHQQEKEN